MSVNEEDVLKALCSGFSLLKQHGAQQVFLITNTREADLARDLFLTHGFDTQLYHEPASSKLYLSSSFASDTDRQTKLLDALSDASTIRSILSAANASGQDPRISFSRFSGHGKRLTIDFPYKNLDPVTKPEVVLPSKKPYIPTTPDPKRRHASKAALPEVVSASPEFSRFSVFMSKKTRENNAKTRISTYVFGNLNEFFYALVGTLIFIFILVFLFTLTRWIICPDLGVIKSRSQFCTFHERLIDTP